MPPVSKSIVSLTASALGLCWKAQCHSRLPSNCWTTARLWTRAAWFACILLFDQAFAEGWKSVFDVCASSARLATVMELNNGRRRGAALVHSRRHAMAKYGPSHSCFELAQDSAAERTLFEKHPDLLFVEDQPDGLVICSSGVYWRHLHFEDTPRQIRITERVADERRSYTLHVGGESVPVRYDPAGLVERLDRWLGFLHEDFQSKAKQTRKWNPPEGAKVLPPGELGVCPECHSISWAWQDRSDQGGGRSVDGLSPHGFAKVDAGKER